MLLVLLTAICSYAYRHSKKNLVFSTESIKGNWPSYKTSLFQAFDSGEQVNSYAAGAKRNTRGKNEEGLGRPIFSLVNFSPAPTIWTPGTG